MQNKIAACILFYLISFSAKPDALPLLDLHSRLNDTEVSVTLTDTQWRWLGEKKTLRIATWEPQAPPFDIVLPNGIFEGISADYLKIISSQLGLPVKVVRYPGRNDAIRALQNNEVDAIVDVPGTTEAGAEFADSLSYMSNFPALVAKESDSSSEPDESRPFKLAVASYYLTDEEIHQLYPTAVITRFSNLQTAFDAIAHSDFDYLLGNMTSVSFFIDRIYNNSLYVLSASRMKGRGGRFIVRRTDKELLSAINSVLSSLTDLQNEAIVDAWFLGSDLSWMHRDIGLTEGEKEWIKEHPTLKVLYNPLDAPLSMEDKSGEVYGVSEDVLRLISLRTGLKFTTLTEPDESRQIDDVISGRVDMLATLPVNNENKKILTLTSPYIFTVHVLVAKKGQAVPISQGSGKKIALVPDRVVEEQLKKKYPGIELVKVSNSALALKMVEDGSVTAAVDHQIGATYLIEHYFPELQITERLSPQTSLLAFALSKSNRELESIINKTLLDIPPRTFSKIFNKWQGTPEIQLKTWQVYSKEQYAIFIFIITACLILTGWGGTLLYSNRIRKRAQKKMEEQLFFTNSLLNGSPTPIYVVNKNGDIISKNRAWHVYFSGLDADTLELSLYDKRHPLSGAFSVLTDNIERYQSNLSAVFTDKFSIFNGINDSTIIHWSTLFSTGSDAEINMICGWHDVTDHEVLLSALSVERDNADRANSAKSSFLATMSHEIRTPISAVIGLLELAECSRTADTPDGEALRLAYASAQSVLDLVGDVLDMAKIEAGKTELMPSWGHPETLISGTVSVFSGLAKQKGIDLITENHLTGSIEILIDHQKLKQILYNFISNAIKFTSEGHVSISLSGHPVDAENHSLQLTVADTGIGISDSGREKLFVPYSQLEAGKKQVGTGLGLVISTELIELMGGKLEMQSKLNKGTTLTVTFSVPYRNETLNDAPLISQKFSSMRKMSILIADDQHTNRHLLSRQLAKFGHQVKMAENGAEALRIWQENKIDLIITDCHMPVMDGASLTRMIRETGSSVPVWGLTANAQQDEITRSISSGMDMCFIKPFRLEELEKNLAALSTHSAAESSIDMSNLSKLCGEDERLLAEMAHKTAIEIDEELHHLKQAIEKNSWDESAHFLHRLTGTAGLIGATSAAAMCIDTESIARHAPDRNVMEEEYAEIEREFLKLRDGLKDWVSRHS